MKLPTNIRRLSKEVQRPPKKKKGGGGLSDKVLNLDMFPSPFFFTLPNGQNSLPSKCGLFVTVILFITITFYGVTQLVTLSAYGNTTVMNNNIDSFYDEEYVFDLDKKDNGFQIAFGITAYDSNIEKIDDPDYATLHARLKQWGHED